MCRAQAAIGKRAQGLAAGGSTPGNGVLGVMAEGKFTDNNKTPKIVKSLAFVSVLSHLINLKGNFVLVLTVLNFFKLQFYSLCTQLFEGRQMGSFTPRADCHFSACSISHAPQELTQPSTAHSQLIHALGHRVTGIIL